MDQGNTDPNNPNPTTPQPMSAPSNFGMDPVVADTPTPPVDQFIPAPPIPAAEPSNAPWGNPVPIAPAPTEPIQPTNQFASSMPPQPVASAFGSSPAVVPAEPMASSTSSFGTPPTTEPSSVPTAFNPFSSPAPDASSAPSIAPETAPTDLTSLAGNSSEATNYVPQTDASATTGASTPESLVVAPPTSTEPAQAVTAAGGGGGFPKIIYIVGGIVLLIVIAVSAYVIFGIGKSADSIPSPTSVPAVQQPVTTPPAALIPSATTSGSFSDLPGGAVPSGTVTPTVAGGTAYDLLRQRQTSTVSATPTPRM